MRVKLPLKRLGASLFSLALFLIFLPSIANAQFSGTLGSISGTVKWGTETPSISTKVKYVGNTTGFTLVNTASPNYSSGFNLPADTYTVTIYLNQSEAPDGLGIQVDSRLVTVAAGQSVTANFDLSAVTGFVKGSLKVNGVAVAGSYQFCGPLPTDPCPYFTSGNPFNRANGPWSNFGDTGFQVSIPPGNYRVHVVTLSRIDAGIVPVTVTAGNIIDDSSLNFQLNLGSISGSVTWGTQAISTPIKVKYVGNSTGFTLINTASPTYNSGFNLPPDTYTVTLYLNQSEAPDGLGIQLSSHTITVASGQAVTANFDLSGNTGLVKGNLKVNGSAVAGSYQFCGPLPTDPCPYSTTGNPFNRANGPWSNFGDTGFQVPLPPGNYRVHVVTLGRVDAGIVPITVTAGQITEGSSLQFQLNLGSISGIVKWATETPSIPMKVKYTGNTTGFSLINTAAPTYSSGFSLPPDTYSVNIYQNQSEAPDSLGILVDSRTITVGSGQSVTANFDLSTVTGFVKGNLKINGVAAPGSYQFCGPLPTDPCPFSTLGNPFNRANGPWSNFADTGFKVPLPPGNYRVHVLTLSRVDMGIIPITVTAGGIVDLATNNVSIPTEQNVEVTVGGIKVTFAEVTSAGSLTLTTTSHPQGPPPPSQYRFLGNYYELTTTAEYSGPITVTFPYDDTGMNQQQESNLKLFHAENGAWQNVTQSVDTVNNTITGVTQTLSPFVVGEPLNTAPTVPGEPVLSSGSSTSNQGEFTLTWNASTDADGDTLTYELQHKDSDDVSFSTVALNITSHSYTFTSSSLESEGTWLYRVKASDGTVSTDFSGESGSIKVDNTSPNAPIAAADRTPDFADWYKDTVTVSFTGNGDPALSDSSSGSGVAAATSPVTKTTSGTFEISGTATDNAGNESAPTAFIVKVDATAPQVTVTCPSSPVVLGSSASGSWTAIDTHSGLAGSGSGNLSLDTTTVGERTVTVNAGVATDNVGHASAEATCSYQVIYPFSGFFQPLENLPTLNKVQGNGRNVKVKFSLGGDYGVDIFSQDPVSQAIACDSGAPINEEVETTEAGPSGLIYDSSNNQYLYSWATSASWAGTCRQFSLKLLDGTEQSVNFQFF